MQIYSHAEFLPNIKVWNFWINYKTSVRKEQKQVSSTRQVGQEQSVATGQALPSPAGPKATASGRGRAGEITESTGHPR